MWTSCTPRRSSSRCSGFPRNVFWKTADVAGIDGAVNGIADGITTIATALATPQSGNTRSYAVWVVIGALVVLAMIFFWRVRETGARVGALMLQGGHLLSVLIFFPAVGALALMMLRAMTTIPSLPRASRLWR